MTTEPLTLESIVIDDEFVSLMPRLADEERTQLHVNMLRAAKTGDRIPDLAVWKGKNILLDGHNRLEIAKSNELVIGVTEIDLHDRAAARKFIVDLHRGRRNMTPEQLSYFRGKQYEAEKREPHRPDKVAGSATLSTADKIAKEHGVSPRTIREDAHFAKAVDRLADESGPSARRVALDGSRPKSAVVAAAFGKRGPSPQTAKRDALAELIAELRQSVRSIVARCPAESISFLCDELGRLLEQARSPNKRAVVEVKAPRTK
ncbi:MAG TPA: hypothetical protein VGP76_17885 [Planctomycetaceae bacterium]|jgi:hypothetical protein|nr:hypothetical protein [Planctomycetaceae bacterium]